MYILGIETSTQICSAALLKDNQLLAEVRLNLKNVHASRLFEIIQALFFDAGIKSHDIDGIGVSNGPGSFTGLRIGLSAAKGLALPHNTPVVAVSTMLGLVAQAPVRNGIICPILKSRIQEYYIATFRRENYIDSKVDQVQVKKEDELANYIPKGAILVGNIGGLQSILNKEDYLFTPQQYSLPSALNIALLATEKIKAGEGADFETLEPSYFQEFIAGKPKKIL